MKRLGMCLIAVLLLLTCVGCNKEDNKTEEPSVISDGSGGVNGDKTISDVSTASEEDEEEFQRRIQLQASTITSANTEFSSRFLNMRTALLAKDCTFTYEIIQDSGVKTSYVYINNGDDWYYYMKVTDTNGKTSEVAYLEESGVGYSFDYDRKMCVTVPSDQIIRKRSDILPFQTGGIQLQEQLTDTFNGNKYDCDIYNCISAGYTEDMQNLEPKTVGTLKVYFDVVDEKTGLQKFVGMVVDADNSENYRIVVNKFEPTADTKIMKSAREGFKSVTVEEYLQS